jgi:hypothetical protein
MSQVYVRFPDVYLVFFKQKTLVVPSFCFLNVKNNEAFNTFKAVGKILKKQPPSYPVNIVHSDATAFVVVDVTPHRNVILRPSWRLFSEQHVLQSVCKPCVGYDW